MNTRAWVIGASGLLGSATKRAIAQREDWTLMDVPSLPWHDDSALVRSAELIARELVASPGIEADSWTVLWLGGAGVTSSPESELRRELDQLHIVLDTLGNVLDADPSGSIFYASSAGGVYSGSDSPPFTEETAPVPLAAYGRSKLEAEGIVHAFARRVGIPSLAGRLSNLYGPGQKLDKLQGIISHVARAQYSPTAASVFVPLDTMRDYLYVDDAASLVLDAMSQLRSVGGHHVKILASQTSATIGELLGQFHALTKVQPHVMLGQSEHATSQAIDLRLRSKVWPHLDERDLTPLPIGMHRTLQSVLAGLVEPAR